MSGEGKEGREESSDALWYQKQLGNRMLQQRTWNMDSASQGPAEDGSDVKKAAKVEVPESGGGGSDEGKQEVVVAAAAAAGRQQQQQAKPVLKKPDKLAPCPRCDSLDTKFCYYNNYNVNQPRHFCKNCQRYWTAGGTLRNVPVGAGRRKNKHGSLQARHGQVPPEHVVVRLEPPLRPCHARSSPAAVPDRTCAPLASSSSDPSSQERPVSSAHAQAVRRLHIPEPQASMSSERGGGRMGDAEQWASSDPEGEGEGEAGAEKEECGTSSAAAGGYSSELEPTTAATAAAAAQEVQSTSREPVPHVVAGVVRGVGVIDGAMWTAAAAAAAAAAPFGIFNGSWPFGYNVGWSGPPPGSNAAVCPPPGGAPALWSAAPPNGPTMWPGAMCWGSTLIPGVPWMAPAGWSMPPWAATAGDAAAAAAAAAASMQASAAAAAAAAAAAVPAPPTRFPIRPVLSKHPRDRLELDRVESSLWVPKMVRLEDSPRSSVWTAVDPGSNFKAFLPVATSINSDDDSKAASPKRVGSS